MKQFQIKPIIQCYETLVEFIADIDIGAEDCLFTLRHFYENFFSPLKLPCAVLLFDDYGFGEPTDSMIDHIRADFSVLACKRVIAVGGGSVLDIAKLLALKSDTGPTLALFTGQVQPVKDKPLVLVPTTCGTGSEVTCISIAGLVSKGTKKGLATDALFADKAVLIPELLHGLPRQVLITSSLDAFVHATESYLSPRAHAYSELFSMEALRLLVKSYKSLLAHDYADVVQVLAPDLLAASNYAGIAFGNVGVGAVHALAYPLGEHYHVSHGEACARFFYAVFDVYRRKNPHGKMNALTQLFASVLDCAETEVWQCLRELLNKLLPEKPLRDYGMDEDCIEKFADSVVSEQQRLLVNNYVALSRSEIRDIFKSLW